MTTTPTCDLCQSNNLNVVAAYDAKTIHGTWAYLCEDHWVTHGVGRLGMGFGQRLTAPPTPQLLTPLQSQAVTHAKRELVEHFGWRDSDFMGLRFHAILAAHAAARASETTERASDA